MTGRDPLLLRRDLLPPCFGDVAARHLLKDVDGAGGDRSSVTIERADWSSISIFARRVSGIVSVGLNALAFVYDT